MLQNLYIVIAIVILSYLFLIWLLNAIDRFYCFLLFLIGFSAIPAFYIYLFCSYFGGAWENVFLQLYLLVTAALLLGLFIASQISLYIMKSQIKAGTIGQDPLRRYSKLKEKIKNLKPKLVQGRIPVKLRPERQGTLNNKLFDPVVDKHVNVIRNHRPEYLLELIGLGASLHARDDYNKTLLMKFAKSGLWKKVAVLLELGVDLEAQDEEGKTAYIYAAERSALRVLHILIAKGADTKAKDNVGKTALMSYLENRVYGESDFFPYIQHRPMLETLLLYSDINAKDNSGSTPLMYAVGINDKRILKKLIKMGAKLDEQDNYGRTAIMRAISNKKEERIADPRRVVKVLIKSGAKLDLKDNKGRTALEQAQNAMFSKIEAILKKAMIK